MPPGSRECTTVSRGRCSVGRISNAIHQPIVCEALEMGGLRHRAPIRIDVVLGPGRFLIRDANPTHKIRLATCFMNQCKRRSHLLGRTRAPQKKSNCINYKFEYNFMNRSCLFLRAPGRTRAPQVDSKLYRFLFKAAFYENSYLFCRALGRTQVIIQTEENH